MAEIEIPTPVPEMSTFSAQSVVTAGQLNAIVYHVLDLEDNETSYESDLSEVTAALSTLTEALNTL